MLGGRVKTLHPRIHAGILARRDVEDGPRRARRARDRAVRPRLRQPLPVRAGRARARRPRGGGGRDDRHRRPVDAARGREELRARRARLPARAVRAACSTSCARAASSRSRRAGALAGDGVRDDGRLRGGDRALVRRAARRSRRSLTLGVREGRSTSPTARTRTSAPPTTPSAAPARTCSRASSSSHGRELSFNNLNDLDAARLLVREFALPACVIVKHANPCGVAVARDDRGGVRARARGRPALGVRRRRRAQPRRSSAALGERLAEQFVEVLLRARLRRGRARGAAREAGDPDPRRHASGARPSRGERDYKRVLGGLLVQDRDCGRRGPRGDGGRLRASRPRRSGATCSSPGASASTSPRTRS